MPYNIREIAMVSAGKISQLDVVTNNLANIGTPGFKFENMYHSVIAQNENIAEDVLPTPFFVTNFSQGTTQKTDNLLDLAIQGEGFFTIQTSKGIAYTRKGNFTINKDKELVTQTGDQVLGFGGKITINGQNVHIDNRGVVKVDNEQVGRLKIVKFDNLRALVKDGKGLYIDHGEGGMVAMDNSEVNSMHIELANVNAIREMANMIDIQRSFEFYQKLILTLADMDKLSTGRLGKLV